MIGFSTKRYICPHVHILGKSREYAERFYKEKHFSGSVLKHRIENKKILVTLQSSTGPAIDLVKCVGNVKSIDIQEDGTIEVAVNLFNVPNALIAENLGDSLYLTPVGTGTVKDGVVQDDYRLYYFSLERR